MISRSLRHRAPALWLLMPMMAGLTAAHLIDVQTSIPIWLLVAGVALGVAIASPSRLWVWALALSAGVFAAAFAYYEVRLNRLADWEGLPGREITIGVRLHRLFNAAPEAKTQGALAIICEAPPEAQELNGQPVYLSFLRRFLSENPLRSETLRVRGILESLPEQTSAATFDGFLANTGTNFRLTRAVVEEQIAPPSLYRRFCARAHRGFSHILGMGLEERPELAAVLRGILLGHSAELSKDQQERFVHSGTMHLFSVSGLHIAAIAIAVHMLAALCRLRGWWHAAFTVGVLWLYVDITGTSPSAVRAFVMVALVEAAFALQRPINPLATLGLAAVVTLVIDPFQLFGPSFQMSYGIVAGLLLWGLPLAEHLQEKTRLFRDLPKVVWTRAHHLADGAQRAIAGAVGVSIATGAVSSLAGLLYFSVITPGALAANLVLMPLSTLALWAGFLSLIAGLCGATFLVVLFNKAAALTLLVMDYGIRALVSIPGSSLSAEFRSLSAGFGSFVGLLVLLGWGYCLGWQRHRPVCWMPLVWLLLTVGLAVRW